MKEVSKAFRDWMDSDHRNYYVKAKITLVDGTELEIDNSKIWDGGFALSSATSSANQFDVGCAVSSKLTLVLNNIYEEFSAYDFSNANVSVYELGLELEDGSKEGFRIGEFIVDTPSYNGSTIQLVCLDYMCKFQRPYSESELVYPATLLQITREACSHCGVMFRDSSFYNCDFVVKNKPDSSRNSYLDILVMVSQLACSYAKVDGYGELHYDWYTTDYESIIDGGTFKGGKEDELDGGDFAFRESDFADGGGFDWDKGSHEEFVILNTFAKLTINTDDTIITGIKVTSSRANGDTQTYFQGEEGYVIEITNNEMISTEDVETVCKAIGKRCIGARFRGFNCNILSDPTIEAGDAIYITSRKGEFYQTLITQVNFKIGSFTTLACGSKSVRKNSATQYSTISKVYEATKQLVDGEKTERELAQEILEKKLEESSGLYNYEEEQPDGSVISYVIDHPTIEESKLVIRFGREAIGISTDGGATYPYGIDLYDATMIMNRIYANKLSADVIEAGILQDKTGKYSLNMDTGEVIMANANITGGSFSVRATESGKNYIELHNDNYSIGIGGNYLNLKKMVSDRVIESETTLNAGSIFLQNVLYHKTVGIDYNGLRYSQFQSGDATLYPLITLSAPYTDGSPQVALYDVNTHKARVILSQYGLSFYDANGNLTKNYPST